MSLAQVTQDRDLLLALLVRFGQSCIATRLKDEGADCRQRRVEMVLPSGHRVEWTYNLSNAHLFVELPLQEAVAPQMTNDAKSKLIGIICMRFDQNRPQVLDGCIVAEAAH
jgi:hypothetical protein